MSYPNESFQNELEQLINNHSDSLNIHLPDIVIRDMICNFIRTLKKGMEDREGWYYDFSDGWQEKGY